MVKRYLYSLKADDCADYGYLYELDLYTRTVRYAYYNNRGYISNLIHLRQYGEGIPYREMYDSNYVVCTSKRQLTKAQRISQLDRYFSTRTLNENH